MKSERQFFREEAEWREALKKHYMTDDGQYFGPDGAPCSATAEDLERLRAAAVAYAPRPQIVKP